MNFQPYIAICFEFFSIKSVYKQYFKINYIYLETNLKYTKYVLKLLFFKYIFGNKLEI